MDTLTAKDLQIFREKSRAFCGSFKIPLDKLQHEDLPNNPRQLDKANVARLVNVFHDDECLRRDSDNYVPALINRSALPDGPIRVGDLPLFDLPFFEPSDKLVYLHGRHRLEAAREFFSGNDRWWIVNLYSDG